MPYKYVFPDCSAGQEVGVASLPELRDWFQRCYQERVESVLEDEVKVCIHSNLSLYNY